MITSMSQDFNLSFYLREILCVTEHETGFTSTPRDAVPIALKKVKYNLSCTQEVLKRGNRIVLSEVG